MSRAWWRAPGSAVAALITAAVAATGCAANAKNSAASPTRNKSPAATVATSTPVPASAPQVAGDPAGILVPPPPMPSPVCPPLVHYAARNAGPLFCTDGKDNPAALRYFTTLHLKIMGLPASAPQSQAITAICADLKHIGKGAEYSAYLLAATREHWYFTGIAKVHGNLPTLCHNASPSPTPSPGAG